MRSVNTTTPLEADEWGAIAERIKLEVPEGARRDRALDRIEEARKRTGLDLRGQVFTKNALFTESNSNSAALRDAFVVTKREPDRTVLGEYYKQVAPVLLDLVREDVDVASAFARRFNSIADLLPLPFFGRGRKSGPASGDRTELNRIVTPGIIEAWCGDEPALRPPSLCGLLFLTTRARVRGAGVPR